MSKTNILLLLALLASTGATSAFGSATELSVSGGSDLWVFDQIQWDAQQFTLNDRTQINTISLAITASADYTVGIESNLTGGSFLWTSPSVDTSDPTFDPVSLILDPGTYYLVGPTSGGYGCLNPATSPAFECAFWNGGGTVVQSGGSVEQGFYSSSNEGGSWIHRPGDALDFDITGNTLSPSPEPGSTLLFSTGMLGILAMVFRGKRLV